MMDDRRVDHRHPPSPSASQPKGTVVPSQSVRPVVAGQSCCLWKARFMAVYPATTLRAAGQKL